MSVALLRRREPADATEAHATEAHATEAHAAEAHEEEGSTPETRRVDVSTRERALERLGRWIDEGDPPAAFAAPAKENRLFLASPLDRLGTGAVRMAQAEMRKEAEALARVAAGHVARKATAKVARFFAASGERQALLALSNVPQRALANLARNVPAKVERHILEHVREVEGKAVHSLFERGTSMPRIVELMRQTLRAGSRPILSVSDDGALAFVLEKEFPSAIGSKGEKLLRMVVDLQGRLVTAFPIAAEKKLATLSVRGVTVAASLAPLVFLGHLAQSESEAACADARTRSDAVRQSSWIESVLALIGPYGILDSSPIALEPNLSAMRARTNQAMTEASAIFGRPLTEDEQRAIKACVGQVWVDAANTTAG